MTVVEQLNVSKAAMEEAKVRMADMESVIAGHLAKQAELDAKLVELNAAIAKHDEAIKAEADKLTAEVAAHAATKAELEKAQVALSNPAFADAAVVGSANPVPEGGSAPESTMTKEQAREEYWKLNDDPVAQARYLAEHRKELGL